MRREIHRVCADSSWHRESANWNRVSRKTSSSRPGLDPQHRKISSLVTSFIRCTQQNEYIAHPNNKHIAQMSIGSKLCTACRNGLACPWNPTWGPTSPTCFCQCTSGMGCSPRERNTYWLSGSILASFCSILVESMPHFCCVALGIPCRYSLTCSSSAETMTPLQNVTESRRGNTWMQRAIIARVIWSWCFSAGKTLPHYTRRRKYRLKNSEKFSMHKHCGTHRGL